MDNLKNVAEAAIWAAIIVGGTAGILGLIVGSVWLLGIWALPVVLALLAGVALFYSALAHIRKNGRQFIR